jgi:sialate O-acetylesterase
MIAPLTNFKIGGVLWYQGESNTANAESYQQLFSNMITSWRGKWKNDFPFYYVQIAPFKYGRPYEGGVLRDQQRRTLALKNTGMAMTSDICTVEDIHPQNKQDVGLRLANIALKQHFKVLNKEVYGPLFESAKINGNQIEVVFSNDDGLFVKDKKLEHFEIANESRTWFPAKAKLKDGIVLVSAKEVKNPKAVRYAWKSTAIGNLFNGVGLPASTFTSSL